MSAVDFLAHHKPEQIKQLFITDRVTPVGEYCVRFYINGREEKVVIDDYLPSYVNEKTFRQEPAFTTGVVKGEIWPCLLEKAWAKLHGSYCMIKLGSPTIALQALSPDILLHKFFHDDYKTNPAELRKSIEDCLKAKQILVACQWDNDLDNEIQKQLSAPLFTVTQLDNDEVHLLCHSCHTGVEIDEYKSKDHNKYIVKFDEFFKQFMVTMKVVDQQQFAKTMEV